MKTIDFDIEKAKSGNYKIVTKGGKPARIICWDKDDGDFKIVALIKDKDCYEFAQSYKENGSAGEEDHDALDLRLQVEDDDKLTWEDLNEFEYVVAKALYDESFIKTNNQGILKYIKQLADELYEAAEKQFIQEQRFKEINDEVKQYEFVYRNGKFDIEKKETAQPTFDGICIDTTKPNNKRYVEEHTFKAAKSADAHDEEVLKRHITKGSISWLVGKVLKETGWCMVEQDKVTDAYDLTKSVMERLQRISNVELDVKEDSTKQSDEKIPSIYRQRFTRPINKEIVDSMDKIVESSKK